MFPVRRVLLFKGSVSMESELEWGETRTGVGTRGGQCRGKRSVGGPAWCCVLRLGSRRVVAWGLDQVWEVWSTHPPTPHTHTLTRGSHNKLDRLVLLWGLPEREC